MINCNVRVIWASLPFCGAENPSHRNTHTHQLSLLCRRNKQLCLPTRHPAVWYDYQDDWAEAKIVSITGHEVYSIDVENVGMVDDVSKAELLPVE